MVGIPVAAYAKINFDEIEPGPSADGFEGRFAREHLDSRDLGVSRWRYGSGVRSPVAHHHREQEEAYVVLSGSGRALLDGDLVDLREGDVLRVAPAVIRAFEGGEEGLELFAIGGPRPEGGDGEVVEAAWPE